MTKTKCLRCYYTMTWEQQRRQYGRLMKRGMTQKQAQELLPRCQKCMTEVLRDPAKLSERFNRPTPG
jgi:NAD-dependent SIR2 family protein deacetylase